MLVKDTYISTTVLKHVSRNYGLSEQNLKKKKTVARKTIQGMGQGKSSKVLFCFFSFIYFTLKKQDKISNFTLYHTDPLHLLLFLPLHFENFAITWVLVRGAEKMKA